MLGHGTDSFTSPPEEGMLRPGLNPKTLGARGQHDNHWTTEAVYIYIYIYIYIYKHIEYIY